MTIIVISAIILLIGIDQAIKLWASNNLIDKGSVQFIHFGNNEIINLSYFENTGAAFSILEGKTIFLSIITLVVIVLAIYYVIKHKVKQPLALTSFALLIAGGIGNLIDRIFRGYVIDYIEIRLFNFAVFNFADCCVVIGAFLLVIYILFFEKSDKIKNK